LDQPWIAAKKHSPGQISKTVAANILKPENCLELTAERACCFATYKQIISKNSYW
jgi:hypothetical protein